MLFRGVFCLVLMMPLVSWPAVPITLSPAQVRTAGIKVEAAAPAASAATGDASGLLLAGQVTPTGAGSEVIISAVAGQVESIAAQAGVTVRPGQELLRIRSGELAGLQRAYLDARSQDQLAGSRLERDEALFHDGIITGARLGETRAARQAARAAMQEQRRVLQVAGYTASDIDQLRPDALSASLALRAGRGGVVLEDSVRAGQHVEPGAVLMRLASTGAWWIELRATASQAAQLSVGDAVRVQACGGGSGHVIAIGAQVDSASQTVPVRAEFPDGGGCLRANQYVQATVHPEHLPADWILVPASALIRSGERTYVFVEKNPGVYQPTLVEVARRQGTQAWIRAGITAGTRIVTSGTVMLRGAWLGLGSSNEGG